MSSRGMALVLVGLKGSGKSFIGRLLEERLGVPFLRVEPIFLRTLSTSRLTGAARDAEGYARVLEAIDDGLARWARLTLESTGASEAFPDFLAALRQRCEVRLIAVRAPPDLCLERVRTRDQAGHIPVSDGQVLEVNARAAGVALPWDLVIDNGGPAPAAAILEAFGALLADPGGRSP